MKKTSLDRLRFTLAGFCLLPVFASGQLTEGFDNIATLPGSGWVQTNMSSPIGLTNWFQGSDVVFPAYTGATTSYIGANFNNGAGLATISNWLIAPNMTIKNGDIVRFHTRTTVPGAPEYPDNLQLRMSTAGASSNVGGSAVTVGDFTTLLLEINPTFASGVYPQVWTEYSVTISGLSAPVSGRFALRYFMTNSGPSGANGDYIGIDNFIYIPYVCPAVTVTPPTLPDGTAGSAYGTSLSNTGTLGAVTYVVTAGSLPPGMSLSTAGTFVGSPTATGTYNFTVTVTDASGCSGSTSYSLTINCPTGGASLAAFPDLCEDDPNYALTEGSPSGGAYTGTGVTGSAFDPSAGTSLITYTLTDVYSCLQVATGTITVNPLPSVTLTPFPDVCEDPTPITLSGGSPAGGTYSGTSVSAGEFDPSNAGTFTITYTYTDVATGCINQAAEDITVNANPTVTLSPFSDVCEDAGAFALTGGSPSGGTYSGTGVSAGMFDPATLGTFSITYDYTDGNGCIGQATEDITVIVCNGLPEIDGLSDFKCYPNPSSGTINVQFLISEGNNTVLKVLNSEGKIVMKKDFGFVKESFNESLNLSSLAKGIYQLEVQSGDGFASQRIVLQ